jgi:hypothetical protein
VGTKKKAKKAGIKIVNKVINDKPKQEIKHKDGYESSDYYKQIMDLINYMDMILLKFPRTGRQDVGARLKNRAVKCLELFIRAWHCDQTNPDDLKERIKHLHEINITLRVSKSLVRTALHGGYLKPDNHSAWVKKIYLLNIGIENWKKKCQKENEK